MSEKPWWMLRLTDAAWCEEHRRDYPDQPEQSDDAIRERYADGRP